MITALVCGKVQNEPESKISKAGKAYVETTVRAQEGNELTYVKVITFDADTCRDLAELHAGQSVAIEGWLKLETYARGEDIRIKRTLFADAVLTLKRPKKSQEKRKHNDKEKPVCAGTVRTKRLKPLAPDDGSPPWDV